LSASDLHWRLFKALAYSLGVEGALAFLSQPDKSIDIRELDALASTHSDFSLTPFPGTAALIAASGSGSQEALFIARATDGRLRLQQIATRGLNGFYIVDWRDKVPIATQAARPFLKKISGDPDFVDEYLGHRPINGELFDAGALLDDYFDSFLVHEVGGKAYVDPTGSSRLESLRIYTPVGKLGLLMGTRNGLFLSVNVPLKSALADVQDREELKNLRPEPRLDSLVEFTISHPCAPVLRKLGLTPMLIGPTGQWQTLDADHLVAVRASLDRARITLRLPIHTTGIWGVQFVVPVGGVNVPIGGVRRFEVSAPVDFRSVLEMIGLWISIMASIFLALLNATVFVAARRSALAWRIATDDTLAIAPLRIFTGLLSHLQRSQLWILDLYFKRCRGALEAPRPFLPLPLVSETEKRLASEVVAPPWTGKRIWIQGNSGMGKSALFYHTVREHFCHDESSFSVFGRWGCVLVAFSARDFTAGDEDRPDPTWVIEALKATLSQRGLSFDDDKLLKRVLRTGTLGVAIDGLHEANRSKAVEAFARMFETTPLFVTSQEPGTSQFTTWRLPSDMRSFTGALLRAYLGHRDGGMVLARISQSGLAEAVRSGYDVRLIIDMTRVDPRYVPLPSARASLYEAVVLAAWPWDAPELVTEQQGRLAAAAWRMVSERRPNEDKRRLLPDVDLEEKLLVALADAPEREHRSVRLIRRVGNCFEFVHDQMHAYLAARWFAQPGFAATELTRMVAASTIWTDAPSARRTLWSFVAMLLDDARLMALLSEVDDEEEWDILRRQLKEEAQRRSLLR
jgi:hypothetical protein